LNVESRKGHNPERAFRLMSAAAENGAPPAVYALGAHYATGSGVAQDYHKARELFERAANAGISRAQFNLAVLQRHGQGGATDEETAVFWFKRAAEQGFPPAFHFIGEARRVGWGSFERKPSLARPWYEAAAANGYRKAQDALRRYYGQE
jgi:TPR repeat protein